VLGLLVLQVRSSEYKGLEILVFRHELAIALRQFGKPGGRRSDLE